VLTSLQLINFQKHASRRILFDPGVNFIVGATDKGKSSTVRALSWCLLNTPRGVGHIRHGAKECTVTVEMDGRTITRIRNKKENVYLLDGERFVSFGEGVPEEIAAVVGITGAINIQGQHAGPFWLDSSAPEVARQLNAIVDLTIIDESTAYVTGTLRRSRSALTAWEDITKARTAELEKLRDVPQMAQAFRAIEETHKDWTAQAAKRDTLADALADIEETAERVKYNRRIVSKGRMISRLGPRLEERRTQRDALRACLFSCQKAERRAKVTEARAFIRMAANHAELAEVIEKRFQLSQVLADLKCRKKELKAAKSEYAKVKKKYKKDCLITCPKCATPITLLR